MKMKIIFVLMGLIKYSPLVTTMNGKLSGGKLYKGRSGNIISTKVKPVNRRTSTQLAARAALKEYSGLWKTIFDIQRSSWDSFASAITKKNRVGDTHVMTGFAAFVSENTRLQYASPGAAEVDIPPANITPTLNGNFANAVAVGSATQTFVIDIPLVTTGDILVLSATPGVSPGRTFVTGKFRPILRQSAHAAQTAQSIYSGFESAFGELRTSTKIYLKAEYISIAGSKISKFPAGGLVTVTVS